MAFTSSLVKRMTRTLDAALELPGVKTIAPFIPTNIVKSALQTAAVPVEYIENAAVDNAGYYGRKATRALSDKVITATSRPVVPGDLRDIFRDEADMTLATWTNSHTHCEAAQYRSEFQALATKIAARAGRPLWINSRSNSDIRNGYAGKSCFWHTKDLTKAVDANDAIRPEHLIALHDDDYYDDDLLPFLARANPNPVIISTFVPTAVTGDVPDGKWWTNADNTVTEMFRGGSRYTHGLYEWMQDDHLVATGWFNSVVYLKEMRVHPKDPTRVLILLTPMRVMLTQSLLLVANTPPTLRRRKFYEGGFVVSRYFKHHASGRTVPYISVARPGDCDAATLPFEVARNCYMRWAAVKQMQTSTVQVHLERAFREKDEQDNTIYDRPVSLATTLTLLLSVFTESPEILSRPCWTRP